MKPLTRKEAIINGDDITPVNRQKYWLKQMGGGGTAGSGVFFVKIEWDDSQEEYALKTPYQQIKEAYEAGKFLVADMGSEGTGLVTADDEGIPGEEHLVFWTQVPHFNNAQTPFVNVYFVYITEDTFECDDKAFYFGTAPTA